MGPAIADALTGHYAAYGILGALHERERTGVGRLVEVSMFEAMAHFNLDAFTHLFSEGEVMGPYSRPSVSQSYALACADGKWIALHMSSPPKFWQGLAAAIERPTLFDDPRFATRPQRIVHHEVLIELLGGIFRGRERADWCARLEARDVPYAPMYTSAEVPDDLDARLVVLGIDHPYGKDPGSAAELAAPRSDGRASCRAANRDTCGPHRHCWRPRQIARASRFGW